MDIGGLLFISEQITEEDWRALPAVSGGICSDIDIEWRTQSYEGFMETKNIIISHTHAIHTRWKENEIKHYDSYAIASRSGHTIDRVYRARDGAVRERYNAIHEWFEKNKHS